MTWHIYIIVSLLAILGAFSVQRYIAHRNACAAFRSAILSELKEVYPIASRWPDDIGFFLESKFSNIQAAVTNFRPFIAFYNRRAFNNAWRIYRVGEDGREIDKQCYHQYMGFTIDDHYIDPRKQLTENVDRLLKYAKT